ncbi:MAG: PorV/PorQ family protein [Elusimicrobia bacterium]|nr:PorV/PorQ family protein [Elusimicrobiota bacterium]
MKRAWVGRLLVGYLALAVSPLLAKGPGTTAAPFLTISFGSRAQALGNSFVALADDASSAYFNPAGLAQAQSHKSSWRELQASRSAWFQGIEINQMALASFHPDRISWGLSLTGLEVEDLERRTTESEKPDGYFRAEDHAFGLSLARRMGDGPIALGLTSKIVQQRIASAQGHSFGLDAGAQVKFKAFRQPFSAGFAVRNLGPQLHLGREAFPLPLSYHFGIAYRGLVNQVMELSVSPRGRTDISLGTEYWFLGVFGIRGGYLHSNRSSSGEENSFAGFSFKQGVTGGFGFKVMNFFSADYAFVPFGDLGYAQRFTMSYKF